MEVLGHVELGEVLLGWALHEWHGRLRQHWPLETDGWSPEETRASAVATLLRNRINVLSVIIAAGIMDCVRVRVSAADVPSIRAMGALPVTEWSRNKLAEKGGDASADYVRGLASGAAPVGGPVLAVARDTEGPITVFDGMHRMAAWVAHINDGRGYPVEINLVLTDRPCLRFELAESG